jgi:hypothetical protein
MLDSVEAKGEDASGVAALRKWTGGSMSNRLCRVSALLAMTLTVFGVACSSRISSREEAPTAPLTPVSEKPLPPNSSGLKFLILEGSPRNRGYIHGRVMKDKIHEIVQLWKEMIVTAFKTDADVFIHQFIRKTQFVAAIEKWTPDLLKEIRGLADGAAVDFDTMLLLQLPDECFIHGQAIAADRCSSLGFSREGSKPCVIAQNMDVPAFADGYQLVLRVKEQDSDTEAFVLTQAGCIGLNGMNNQAIGICCNALWQLNCRRDGLPVACIVRGVLRQRSEADAIAFLHKVQHASGQNYLLGGPERAYSFECSANRIERFKPAGREDVVWHTNHPLVNDDCNAPYRELRADSTGLEKREADTRARLCCLEKRATDGLWRRDEDLVQLILRSQDPPEHPVSRPKKDKSGSFTFASTIMVLSDKPVLHFTFGPPDRTPYEHLSFDSPQ